MQYNNKNNLTLAYELDDVLVNLSSYCLEEPKDAVTNIESELRRVDSISQELETPELRAISHWMLLNLEYEKSNEDQFIELLHSNSFSNWVSILSSILREYNQSLLPELYDTLVNPNWLIKPSIPVLKSFAKWIDSTKRESSALPSTSENIESDTDSVESINQNTEFSEDTDDELLLSPATETEQKHVFEEVDSTILEKDYTNNDTKLLTEFSSPSDDSEALLITEKTSTYYDDVALTDDQEKLQSEDIELADLTNFSDEIQSEHLTEAPPFIKDNTIEEENFDSKITISVDQHQADSVNNEQSSPMPIEEIIKIDNTPVDLEESFEASDSELLESKETLDLGNEFNLEVDDIVMSLATISSTSTDIFSETEKIISELERLDSLSELFAYNDIPKISAWCQSNIRLFRKNQTEKITNFISSGECWSWIELTNACLSDPKELSLFSSLSTELTREEWLEPLEIEDLQNLLLFLRNPESNQTDNSPTDTKNQQESRQVLEEKSSTELAEESKFKLSWDEDTHPELLSAFFKEAKSLVKEASAFLKRISSEDTDKDERVHASRVAHTIKGGSAVVGITGLADYAYQLEKILDYSVNNELSTDAYSLLADASSCLENVFDAVLNKGSEPNELASLFAKLESYADSLEDDSKDDLLEMPALPDFIKHSPANENEVLPISSQEDELIFATETNSEDLESKEIISNDLDDDHLIENILEDEILEEDSLEKNALENSSLSKLDNDDDIKDLSAEIDDITMSLVSITSNHNEVFNHTDDYMAELQRLELLAEISGYNEIAELSQWSQTNLTLFSQAQSDASREFIASGESWTWIEILSAALNDPEEISLLSSLSTELMRDDWIEPLDIKSLQNLLLTLRAPTVEAPHEAKEIQEENNLENETENETTNSQELISDIDEDKHFQENLVAEISESPDFSNTQIISWDEDVHPELLDVYFQETPDQIVEVASLLHKISKGDANKEDHQLAARIAHTIKGASGVLGITSLVELTHKLEDILDFSVNNELPKEASKLLAESSDCLESLFETIQNKEKNPEEFNPVLDKLSNIAASLNSDETLEELELHDINVENSSLPEFIKKSTTSNKEFADFEVTPLEELVALGQSSTKTRSNEAHIRVPVSVIDKLLNLAGELVITSSQVSDKISTTLKTRKSMKTQDIHVHKMLEELSSTILQQEKDQANMLSSLKNSAFDSLEMDSYNELHSVVGLLTESILDSETIEDHLGQQLSDLNEPIRTLDQLNKELSGVILSSRMVSVNTLVPRLERIIRETCRKTDKKAELVVTGKEINVDTDIINGLVDPLLHLLRNAVDHGIETPEDRLTNDKDEAGQITLDFKRQGNFILMQLKDDGNGIDPEMIYQRAIEKGLITPKQEFSKQEMLNLILHAGFTTQDNVSDISGRGVGMDVVKSAIEILKGTLEIDSTIGSGTTFTFKIPLTLVTSATLLVKTSDNDVAIPSDTIEQLYYLSQDKVISRDNDHYVLHEDKEIHIQSLSRLLGWPSNEIDFNQSNTLILIKGENKIHAVHIDEILNSREVVIKSLAPWINGSNGVIGACHLPNGSVAPVLNLPQILKQFNDKKSSSIEKENLDNQTTKPASSTKVPVILVVDDSLSNRKALSLIIEQTKYDVVTAVDGLDALNIMNEQDITMVFTDLEMPRMNGLELTQSIRVWDNYKNIPVIMITSRTTEKHRKLAEKAGVNGYLTKPVVTETLLDSIEQWIRSDSSAVPA